MPITITITKELDETWVDSESASHMTDQEIISLVQEDPIEFLDRSTITVTRDVEQPPTQPVVIHGVTCEKVFHNGPAPWDGRRALEFYHHSRNDDGPYHVNGVDYCGRCHVRLC